MFFANALILLAAAAPAALGMPSPLEERQFGMTTANYDDIPANPLLNTGEVTKPPSPYKGLCYAQVGVGNYSLNVAGFMPHSKPNALYSAPEETLGNPATISTNNCPTTGTFNANSIYVACAIPSATGDGATVPDTCALLFTGTQRNGKTVTQAATYTPPSEINGSMQKVTLSGFSQLTSLTITPTGASKATAVLFLDDFTYSKGL